MPGRQDSENSHDWCGSLSSQEHVMMIPETYYGGVNREDFAQVASVLADDVEFVGTMGIARGIDACLEGLRGMRRSIERFEIVHCWDDGEGNIVVWFAMHVRGID